MFPSPPQGLFKPAQQGHSLATLVLIENSAAMVGRWPDLRDHYLPTLLGTVRKVNPVVPIQVLWIPSCPVSDSEEAIAHPNGTRCNHLPEVRFSPQPNNKITAATLFRVTDLLANTLPETNTTRHLFVIAASGPSENMDVPGLPGADPQTVWQALGSKMTKAGSHRPRANRENIHLHMILNPKLQESEKFTHLFYDILYMQHFQEAEPWFPANTENYRFLLSMRRQGHQEGMSRPFPPAATHRSSVVFAGAPSAVSSSVLTPTSAISGLSIASPVAGSFPELPALPPHPHPPSLSQPPQRIPLPRNNSFPPAGANGRSASRSTAASSTNNSPPPSVASIPSGPDTGPSLVKHLQKVHGLTKKRNYGLQTSRAPFIRDEATASAPYPPHTVDPVNGRPRRNTGVHASKSKTGDDPRRPRRGSVHVGLPESARVSSPESDTSSAPSPTNTVTGVLAPPTGPSLSGYAAMAAANPAPAFTDILPAQQLAPHALAPAQAQAQAQQPHVLATAPLASSSYSNVPNGNADAPVAYSTTTASAVVGTGPAFGSQPSTLHTAAPAAASQPAPGPAGVAPGADDGDKPFIFYPEYEEALVPQPPPLFTPLSAAAATQSASVAHYWPTASADYSSHVLHPAAAPGLLRGNPPSVYDMPAYETPIHAQPAHVQAGVVYASEQSSSLQSWAGY
ncbi:hypothetical protein BC826DRAFT_1037139 [Russula brevipes]|nr:hypothetical protein BC826DRAFT_1037139 [Russula brevipes]